MKPTLTTETVAVKVCERWGRGRWGLGVRWAGGGGRC
jgi:hypothetical protein